MQETDFDLYLKTLKGVDNTFHTYGIMFENAIEQGARQNLIEQSMSEKRNGVRGVSDEVLENQNTFYVIGAFLKLLHEIGFEVEETLDENCDFCGSMLLEENQLHVSVDFNYGITEVDYEISFHDERELKIGEGVDELLDSIFNGWDLPKFNSTLNPSNLYDGFEDFLRYFRDTWSKYKETVKEKV